MEAVPIKKEEILIQARRLENKGRIARENLYKEEKSRSEGTLRNSHAMEKYRATAGSSYEDAAKLYEQLGGRRRRRDATRCHNLSKNVSLSRRGKEINVRESRGLLKKLRESAAAVSIFFLASALILLTFNLTGYAINQTQNITRWASVACFVCGLVFAFIHVRAKKC